jgi:hypothetical protein
MARQSWESTAAPMTLAKAVGLGTRGTLGTAGQVLADEVRRLAPIEQAARELAAELNHPQATHLGDMVSADTLRKFEHTLGMVASPEQSAQVDR